MAGVETPPEAYEALEELRGADVRGLGFRAAAAVPGIEVALIAEGLRVAFAASRARRTTADGPDSREEIEGETDPSGDAASLRFAREAPIETWWRAMAKRSVPRNATEGIGGVRVDARRALLTLVAR